MLTLHLKYLSIHMTFSPFLLVTTLFPSIFIFFLPTYKPYFHIAVTIFLLTLYPQFLQLF